MNGKEEWTSYKGDVLTKPEEVEGYIKLCKKHKELFIEFSRNFYKAWEYTEEHVPVKVQLKKDKFNCVYLRVDFANEWLHVNGPNSWY